jgi:hypothetical protein
MTEKRPGRRKARVKCPRHRIPGCWWCIRYTALVAYRTGSPPEEGETWQVRSERRVRRAASGEMLHRLTKGC